MKFSTVAVQVSLIVAFGVTMATEARAQSQGGDGGSTTAFSGGAGGSYGQNGGDGIATNGGGGGGGPGPIGTTGGAAGNVNSGAGGAGGANGFTGVSVPVGSFTGAAGGNSGPASSGTTTAAGGGGSGGYGVVLTTSGTFATVAGQTFTGGAGGSSVTIFGANGVSGTGGGGLVLQQGGTFTNALGASLIGGATALNPNNSGGTGLETSGTAGGTTFSASVTNNGSITGGAGNSGGAGGAGINFLGGGSLTNNATGIITGGFDVGEGVRTIGGSIGNSGSITGGAGHFAGNGITYAGQTDLTITNSSTGTISGGNGVATAPFINLASGNGIFLTTDISTTARVNNSGSISGGAGGAGSGAGSTTSAGANAIQFDAGFFVVSGVNATLVVNNNNAISGGNGGNGGSAGGQLQGGAGGSALTSRLGGSNDVGNALITNTGTMMGGNGGAGSTGGAPGAVGAGGAGIIIETNATIGNSGTIGGGLSGDGATRADAIDFGAGVHTLTLLTGATFLGNVVVSTTGIPGVVNAATSANNTLNLDGSSTGAVSLSQFQNFGHLTQTGGAGGNWMLTGTGAVTVDATASAGTLTLASGSQLTVPTFNILNSGVVRVDGSLVSTVNVGNGGTLTGVGTVGNTQVNSGATFIPGNATPGASITVAGNLGFQSGALYAISLNPTTSTSTNVTGSASLAGTVNATFANGAYISKQYTILTANSVNGTFNSLTNNNLPANFSDTLSYDGTHAYLNLTLGFSPAPGAPNFVALTVNQRNVASTLVNYFNTTGGIPTVFGTLSTTQLTQSDGEVATGAQKAGFQLMSDFLNLMLDPSSGSGWMSGVGVGGRSGGAAGFAPEQDATLPPEIALAYSSMLTKAAPKPQSFDQRWTAWAAGFGGTSTTRGDPVVVGSTDVRASDYGFAAGADYRVSRDTVAGLAVAGGGTNWNLTQGLGSGRSDAFQAGTYVKTHSGPWYASAALAWANNWFTTNRIAVMGDQLAAKFSGQSYGGRIEAGYRYAVPSTSFIAGITPYVALQAQSFHTPNYAETDLTGGGFGLNYNAMSATDSRSELGARFDSLTMLGAMPLILRARLAWAHDWISNPALGAAFQTLPGTNFIVNGAMPPKDSALTSLGAEWRIKANWSLLGKFDGQFGDGSRTYAGTGTLRYTW